MKKAILLAASFYKKSYYFNEEFSGLPESIQKEMRIACAVAAEKIRGIITAGFYEDGTVFIEASGDESDFDYDEIGARLVVDSLIKEKEELIKAMGLWYVIFKYGRVK